MTAIRDTQSNSFNSIGYIVSGFETDGRYRSDWLNNDLQFVNELESGQKLLSPSKQYLAIRGSGKTTIRQFVAGDWVIRNVVREAPDSVVHSWINDRVLSWTTNTSGLENEITLYDILDCRYEKYYFRKDIWSMSISEKALTVVSGDESAWGIFELAPGSFSPKTIAVFEETLLGYAESLVMGFSVAFTEVDEQLVRTIRDRQLSIVSLTNISPLTEDGLSPYDYLLDWNPQGDRFAFKVESFKGEERIMIWNANGETKVSLPARDITENDPSLSWSADGQQLLVFGGWTNARGYQYSVADRNLKEIRFDSTLKFTTGAILI